MNDCAFNVFLDPPRAVRAASFGYACYIGHVERERFMGEYVGKLDSQTEAEWWLAGVAEIRPLHPTERQM